MRTNRADRDWTDADHHDPVRAALLSNTTKQIDEALRSLAPPWVRTGARLVDVRDLEGMWPGERAAVVGAVLHRRAEFATGRAVLRQLIGDDVEIRVGADRRPLFPAGVTGTLAHDHEVAVAATTTRPSCRALGVDVEPVPVFTPDEVDLILRPDERHLDAHLVFVIKEAVYKAWSSLGGRLVDHHEVAVCVDESVRSFTANVGGVPTEFAGRYVAVHDRYVALVVVDEANAAVPN